MEVDDPNQTSSSANRNISITSTSIQGSSSIGSSQHTIHKLYLLEHPCIVKNMERMYDTIGGREKLSDAFLLNSDLPCSLRPDNIYHSPIQSKREERTCIFLNINVENTTDEKGATIQNVESTKILGVANDVITYNDVLGDFQFFPSTSTSEPIKSFQDIILPEEIFGDTDKWLSKETDYFLKPPSFVASESVKLKLYQYPENVTKEGTDEIVIRESYKRSSAVIMVDLNDPTAQIPTQPDPKVEEFFEQQYVTRDKLNILKEVFERRPIWRKVSIQCITKMSDYTVRYLLPCVAYHVWYGQFRLSWVRFGYDPRAHPESRKYQILDYRMKGPLLRQYNVERNNFYMRKHAAKSITQECSEDPFTENPFDKRSYIFQPGVLPPTKVVLYQYCDIKVPAVMKLLNDLSKNPEASTFKPVYGWVTEEFTTEVRRIMRKQIVDALIKMNPSEELKSRFANVVNDDNVDELNNKVASDYRVEEDDDESD